jgi:hypothetical protein
MVVEFAVGVFDQIVEQVDRHDEKCDYHERDERAGAEVDAGLRVVDFVAGAGLEGVFLWDMLGGKHWGGRLGVRGSRRYAGIWVSVLPLTRSLGGGSCTRLGKGTACSGLAEND